MVTLAQGRRKRQRAQEPTPQLASPILATGVAVRGDRAKALRAPLPRSTPPPPVEWKAAPETGSQTQGADGECTTVTAFYDGGARGNPGKAGAGAWVMVSRGDITARVSTHSVFVGDRETNNVAEYHGCIKALQVVAELVSEAGPGLRIIIKGDSKLVTMQGANQWECHSEHLQPLRDMVLQMMADLQRAGHTLILDHILREANTEADALANAAMDTGRSTDAHERTRPQAIELLRVPNVQPTPDPLAPWSPHPDAKTPRLRSRPSEQELRAVLIALHEASRPLAHLPPPKLWAKSTIIDWNCACARFAPVLQRALAEERNELLQLQTMLDLIELPTLHLLPKNSKKPRPLRPHPDPADTAAQGNPLLNKAKRLVYMDLPGKAMQALLSNGVAQASRQVFEILQGMHPRGAPITTHPQVVGQVHVTPAQAKRHIFGLAGSDTSSADCFGWSATYLLHLRGARAYRGEPVFIELLAQLVAKIANGDVPDRVADVLTCGALFALHKLDRAKQEERAKDGRPPEVRPVNVGCALLRWALKLALNSKPAQRAANKLQPIQLGLAKRGVERMAHLARALHELDYALLKTDFRNGFNALSRQAMLDAINKRCPAMNKIFSKYYGRDAACFYRFDGTTGIILSAEGSRMGCSLGSFGFDVAVQDLYEGVQAAFPEAIIRALTDDLTIALRLSDCGPGHPAPGADEAAAPAQRDSDGHGPEGRHAPHGAAFARLDEILSYIEVHAAGSYQLHLRRDKCKLLLPKGDEHQRPLRTQLTGLEIAAEGLIIAGAAPTPSAAEQ